MFVCYGQVKTPGRDRNVTIGRYVREMARNVLGRPQSGTPCSTRRSTTSGAPERKERAKIRRDSIQYRRDRASTEKVRTDWSNSREGWVIRSCQGSVCMPYILGWPSLSSSKFGPGPWNTKKLKNMPLASRCLFLRRKERQPDTWRHHMLKMLDTWWALVLHKKWIPTVDIWGIFLEDWWTPSLYPRRLILNHRSLKNMLIQSWHHMQALQVIFLFLWIPQTRYVAPCVLRYVIDCIFLRTNDDVEFF